VLLVPEPQRFRIFGSEEESSDSRHFFHFRFSSDPIPNSSPCKGWRNIWLRGYAELVSVQEEARPESK
jgi:hypothetical protein